MLVLSFVVSMLRNHMAVMQYVLLADVAAKILTGIFNFWFNKKLVFCSDASTHKELFKYICLSVGHCIVSSVLVTLLIGIIILPEIVAKMIIDVLLFLLCIIFKILGCSRIAKGK